jgi:hypothetical protein
MPNVEFSCYYQGDRERESGDSMKKTRKISSISATAMLIGLISGCASGAPSIKDLAGQCRTPGKHTWVNFMDARVIDNAAVFENIQIGTDQVLDPSPSCLLAKLSAPAEVFEEIKSSPTGEEFNRAWDKGNVVWTHSIVGDIDIFDISISTN